MPTSTTCGVAALVLLIGSTPSTAEDVIFADNFKDGLSKKWEPVGLDKKDYRIKDGGLEMRVQNGGLGKNTPMLKVILPFDATDTVVASVKVTPLDEFTADKELAGVCLLTDGSPEFAAKKQRVKDKLVFAPGNYIFKGQPGEEGDIAKYEVKYTDATNDAGALRIIVRGSYGYFQVGPSVKDEYKNFFHSALRKEAKERGFCLTATGAPDKAEHWVRFTDFKVTKN